MLYVFWVRSFLGPWMHGCWSAIIAGVAWRESRGGRLRLDLPLLGTFTVVAGMHSLWDVAPQRAAILLFPLIVLVDVYLLRGLILAAHRQELASAAPSAAEGAPAAFHCPACAAPVAVGARFCSACGRSVSDALRPTPEGPRLHRSLRVAGTS